MSDRKARFEARKRLKEDLWDVYLIAANGETQQFGNQGYERRNVRRAIAAIKRTVKEASLVFVTPPTTNSGGGPDDGGEGP